MPPTPDSTGRTISFWMSHEEIDGLAEAADTEEITRNEAGRRAVRDYTTRIARNAAKRTARAKR